MERRDYLKPLRFGNAEKRRREENKNLKEKRNLRRTNNFNIRRDGIAEITQQIDKTINENIPPKTDKVINRKLALQKFIAEREAQKKALKEKKKPPFVVGIPHHGSSPLLKEIHTLNTNKIIKKTTNSPEVRSLRVTRATTRIAQGNVSREKQKANVLTKNASKVPQSVKSFPFKDTKTKFSFVPQKVPQSDKKLTSPHTPTVLKRSVKKKPLKNLSNLVTKMKKTDNLNKIVPDGILAEPLPPVEADEKSPDSSILKEEIVDVKDNPLVERGEMEMKEEETAVEDPPLIERGNMEMKEEEAVVEDPPLTERGDFEMKEEETVCVEETMNKNENNKVTEEVKFQLERLESETTRLLELAEQWQSMVLRERLPQEVVDEVDSVVGQTRLLTSDKFQQFRRLIVEYEQQSGTRPVSLDDLNGFWDMVYLQVESLDKKYAALDILKNNNWVKPEPVFKKKRQPAKTTKVKKTNEIGNTSVQNQNAQLQLPTDEPIATPTTNIKPVIKSVLLNKRRTRSNSPSPYIVMRLSGVGRTPNNLVQPILMEKTPGDKLDVDVFGTPKSSRKNSWTELKQTSSAKVKLELPESIAEEPLPAVTPRRSTRLMAKLQTPASCSACDSAICLKQSCSADRKKESASKNKFSRKSLKFSPSASSEEKEEVITESVQPKEMDDNKPSTSKVKFSLRPSILVIEDKDPADIPKKASKRRQTSLFTADSVATKDQDSEKFSPARRRSTRHSRRVQFESGVAEKQSFKLPATPYRKKQADL